MFAGYSPPGPLMSRNGNVRSPRPRVAVATARTAGVAGVVADVERRGASAVAPLAGVLRRRDRAALRVQRRRQPGVVRRRRYRSQPLDHLRLAAQGQPSPSDRARAEPPPSPPFRRRRRDEPKRSLLGQQQPRAIVEKKEEMQRRTPRAPRRAAKWAKSSRDERPGITGSKRQRMRRGSPPSASTNRGISASASRQTGTRGSSGPAPRPVIVRWTRTLGSRRTASRSGPGRATAAGCLVQRKRASGGRRNRASRSTSHAAWKPGRSVRREAETTAGTVRRGRAGPGPPPKGRRSARSRAAA